MPYDADGRPDGYDSSYQPPDWWMKAFRKVVDAQTHAVIAASASAAMKRTIHGMHPGLQSSPRVRIGPFSSRGESHARWESRSPSSRPGTSVRRERYRTGSMTADRPSATPGGPRPTRNSQTCGKSWGPSKNAPKPSQ